MRCWRKVPPRGAALLIATFFAAMIAIYLMALIRLVYVENLDTDSLRFDMQARYLAESGAEYAVQQLKQTIANNYTMPAGAGIQVLPASGHLLLPGYDPTVQGMPQVMWKAVRIDATATQTATPEGGYQFDQTYMVTARALVPDLDDTTAVQDSANVWHYGGRKGVAYVSKMIDVNTIPLFQYLAFYSAFDLEMLPGNTANLTGRIHSNSNIWIGTESGNTFTINTESMTATGTIQRQRKDNLPSDSNHYMTGTVQIKKEAAPATPVNSTNYPVMAARGALYTNNGSTLVPTSAAPSGYDSNFNGYDPTGSASYGDPTDLASFASGSQTRWNGGVQTGAQSVPTLAAPTDLSAYRPPQPGETPTYQYNSSTKTWGPGTADVPGYYNQNANLVVTGNGTTTTLALQNPVTQTQTTLLQLTSGSVTTNNLKTSGGATAPSPITETTLFNGRENTTVNVTNIDVTKLNAAYYGGTQVFPTTGSGTALYAYRTDTTSTTPSGFRLVNGTTLNNKLTFASEDPVYVQGDFNTTAEKGTAILADAVTLLSNSWSDSYSTGTTKTSGTLQKPTANLNFNAAVMTGNYATIPSSGSTEGTYNGGFENFPRFLEDWSGASKAVNILGSFSSLFTSKYAKGQWVYGGNQYTAPVRNWNFDNMFLSTSNQPPLMPFSVGETRVGWWRGRNTTWWPLYISSSPTTTYDY